MRDEEHVMEKREDISTASLLNILNSAEGQAIIRVSQYEYTPSTSQLEFIICMCLK